MSFNEDYLIADDDLRRADQDIHRIPEWKLSNSQTERVARRALQIQQREKLLEQEQNKLLRLKKKREAVKKVNLTKNTKRQKKHVEQDNELEF